MKPSPEDIEGLLSRALFALPEPALRALAEAGSLSHHAAGSDLVDAPALVGSMFMLANGVILARLAGSVLGDDAITAESPGALFSGDRRGLRSLVADSDVWVMSWGAIDGLRARWPELGRPLEVRLSLRERRDALVTLLARSPRFRSLGATLMRRVIDHAVLVPYVAGDTIFDEGDAPDALYIVVSGEVAIKKREGMDDRALSVVHVGECFGEMALLSGAPRSATAVADGSTELLVLGSRPFAALSRSWPAFRSAILAVSSERSEVNRRGPAPASLVWITSDSPLPAALGARYLADHLLAAYGERAQIADAAAPGDAIESRYVFLVGNCPPATIARLSAVIHLTLEGGRSLTQQLAPETLVHRVELTSDRLGAPRDAPHRPGTLRLRVGALDVRAATLRDTDATTRTAIGRLARSLTHRRVGVALGGGGAWGFAHVPLLQRLAALDIPIDVVSGTSAGSMAGVAFASQGLAGVQRIIDDRRRVALHMASCPVSTRALGAYLASIVPERRVEELPMPFLPVAVDIESGQERVFRRGPLIDAVRASCSFPGIFGPAVFEGRRYVDGCLRNNVPVACLVDEGADFIIASNIIPPLPRSENVYGKNIVARIASELSPLARVRDGVRSLFLSFHDSGERQALAADVTFTPDLSAFLATDFLKANEIVAQAERELPPVLALTAARYKAFLANTSVQRG